MQTPPRRHLAELLHALLRPWAPAVAAVLSLGLASCGGDEARSGVESVPLPTPHEAHRVSLEARGLDETALGREWRSEAERALGSPVSIRAPYAERGRFVRLEADAAGYRIRVDRGERLEIRVGGDLVRSGELLVDLYRVGPGATGRLTRLRSLPRGHGRLDLEPRRSGDFVLRLQPTLFGDGGYRLEVRTVPALTFPVAGRDQRAVWSGFGAPREGGRREHHGVDIFAPRGTPVLAAADAVVRRVDRTPVGGNVVWLRDRRRARSLYYAHLDSQLVRDGERVRMGDTLGLVGNTGNARTTPPHLHFGIYSRGEGPIDPLPFIRVLAAEPVPVEADTDRTGAWARARADGIRLRSGPSLNGEILAELDSEQAFRIVAATGEWYRVRLTDGSEGYVAERVAEPLAGGRLALEEPVGGAGTGGGAAPAPADRE